MSKFFWLTGMFLVVSLLLFTPLSASDQPGYKYEATRDLVRLVDEAAQLIEKEGEAAFTAFAEHGSKWYHDQTYVFVTDLKGFMHYHPEPQLNRKNTIDLKDADGRPLIRWLINEVTGYQHKTKGWAHYRWPLPGSPFPTWKSTYVEVVRAPSDTDYVVGSGLYDLRVEDKFVVDTVKEAVELIRLKGARAFKTLRDPTSEFFFRDTYVFVFDDKGYVYVNPPFGNLEGQVLLDLKDQAGKPFISEMITMAKKDGSGWVEYLWAKPGEIKYSRKRSYVEKVQADGKTLIIGCGAYKD